MLHKCHEAHSCFKEIITEAPSTPPSTNSPAARDNFPRDNFQRLLNSRVELDKLACDATKTAQEIQDFLSTYAPTLTPQQRPILLLLQKRVTQMQGAEPLQSELKAILDQLPVPADVDDQFLNILARASSDKFDVSLKVLQTRTDFQEEVKRRWNTESERNADTFLKKILCDRTASAVALASSPFFQACAENAVNPFSLMHAKREVVLFPREGYSPAHIAALETDLAKLQELFEKNPAGAQFGEATPLGGTVWGLLRARGHILVEGPQENYPSGIQRRFLTLNILKAESCQHLMRCTPFALQPPEEIAYQQYLERKKSGEADPVEIFQYESGELKGQYGLRTTRDLKPNDFVVGYKGVILPSKNTTVKIQVDARTKENTKETDRALADQAYTHIWGRSTSLSIKANNEGSWGELINHGPPKCQQFEFFDEGVPHLGIRAQTLILAGEEVTMDYRIGYFVGRPGPIEISPQTVDKFILETQNLSSMSFRMKKSDDGTYTCTPLKVILQDKQPFVETSPQVVPNAKVIDMITKTFYHNSMLNYICHFPSRALEHLTQPGGYQLAEHWVAILDYCEMEKQLNYLGVSQNTYEDLRQRIQEVLGI